MLKQRLETLFGKELDCQIFVIVMATTLPFIIMGIVAPDLLGRAMYAALHFFTHSCGWMYLSSAGIFVLVLILLAVTPLGKVRLGKDNETPEFGRISWFAMLFSAGQGIALIFYSIAEPMIHYMSPPVGRGETVEAARMAFQIYNFHWGIHSWGMYTVLGLTFAYFQYRKGFAGVLSKTLVPLFGSRFAEGRFGKFVDVLAIWATIFGVTTSLGMGALQITGGLSKLTGLPGGNLTTSLIVVIITACFLCSAVSGIKKGILNLSRLNMLLVAFLFFAFLFLGPFGYILKLAVRATADYVVNFIPFATSMTLFDNPDWTGNWTVFYWAWWIVWAPFVGAFIARVSRGRTVREFILWVMLLPTLCDFLFAYATGGTALCLDLYGKAGIGAAALEDVSVAMFAAIGHLPFAKLLSVVATILIASFFITSADSATYILTRFSTAGIRHRDNRQRNRLTIFWGVILGLLAIVLIYSGGIKVLQIATIVAAFPFMLLMYFLLASLTKCLMEDYRLRKAADRVQNDAEIQQRQEFDRPDGVRCE